jgi:hypothetical protein
MRKLVVRLLAILAGFSVACAPAAPPNSIRLTKADLPYQRLHILKKGDVVSYILPNGRRLVYGVRSDSSFSAEQTTSSGLKMDRQDPTFEQLKNGGVCTSTGEFISIYYFDLDEYHVEVAEDLKATHNLPVIFRVSAGSTNQLSHEELRVLFDRDVPKESGPPLRVPIGTVHHQFNKISDFSVRLIVMNDRFEFDISDNVYALQEEERVAKLASLMNYVVQRYDSIDHISSFAMNILKDDALVCRYEAIKDGHGHWDLRKQ